MITYNLLAAVKEYEDFIYELKRSIKSNLNNVTDIQFTDVGDVKIFWAKSEHKHFVIRIDCIDKSIEDIINEATTEARLQSYD